MVDSNTVDIVVAVFDESQVYDLMAKMQRNPKMRIVGFANSSDTLIEKVINTKADAILMDFTLIDATAITIAEKLRELNNNTSIFAMSEVITERLLFEATNNGVVKIYKTSKFEPIFVGEDIYSYINNKNVTKKDTEGFNKINEEVLQNSRIKQTTILTYNTKGGVGKSTIAVNLAVALNNSDVRDKINVVIVDFDCAGSNVATFFNIPPRMVMSKNLSRWKEIYEDITNEEVNEMLIEGPNGIRILPAPLDGNGVDVDFKLADNILTILKKYFDIVVIDGAPNISALIDAAIQQATHILMIANKETQSVQQLSRIINFFNVKDPDDEKYRAIFSKMLVVVNEAQLPTEWDLDSIDISRTLNRPFLREIPYSNIIKETLHGDSNKQAIELFEKDDFTIAIKKLANDLCGVYPDVSNGNTSQKHKGIRNISNKKGKKAEKKGLITNILRKEKVND